MTSERLKQIFDAMIGGYLKQPLHTSLRQLKFVPVGLIVSSQLILWEIVQKLDAMDNEQATVALGAIAAALIAAIWKGLETTQARFEKDERD